MNEYYIVYVDLLFDEVVETYGCKYELKALQSSFFFQVLFAQKVGEIK